MAFKIPSITSTNLDTGLPETVTDAYGVITELTIRHHDEIAEARFAVYASSAARVAGGRQLIPLINIVWSGNAYTSVFGAAPYAPASGLTVPTTAEDIALAQAYNALPANPATAAMLAGATAL